MSFKAHIKYYSFLLLCGLATNNSLAQETKSDSIISNTVPEKAKHSLKADGALESKVDYKADDSLQIDIKNKKVYLYGNAQVNYEKIILKADYIEIDFANNLMYSSGLKDSLGKVKGNPVFSEQNQEFKAKKITYNFETKKGKISNVFTSQDQGYIHGETIKKINDDSYYIKDGKYTTCENEDPHFYIASNKLKVVNKDKIVTGPAYLVIADVPTPLAIPFGFFPNTPKKHSGILIPTYGETASQGFFFEQGGYYFALSDYLDLILRGSIYTRGSWRSSAQLNYKKRYKYNGGFSFDYSNRKFGVKGDTVSSNPFREVKDFKIRWNHTQDAKAKPNSSFSASVNAGTSSYNQNNTNTPDNFLSGTLQSSIAYRKKWSGKPYSFSANFRHSQNTQTKAVNLTLPELYFGVNRQYPFRSKTNIVSKKWYKNVYENISVGYTTNFKNQVSTFDSLLFKSDILDEFRNGIRHNIPVNTSFKLLNHLTVSPSFSYNENWYNKTTERTINPTNNQVIINNNKVGFARVYNYSFRTSLSTNVYGMFAFKSKNIKAIRHVLRPSISVNLKPDFSEDKFGFFSSYQDTSGTDIEYNRFSNGIYGGVSSGKSKSMGLSLNNTLEMKVRSNDSLVDFKKIKLLEALSFSTNYNYALDSLKLSPINISGRTTIAKKLRINFRTTLDPYILDSLKIRKINKYRYKEDGKLGRTTSANAAIGFSLKSNTKKGYKKPSSTDLERLSSPYSSYVDFNIPWNLSFNYNVNYSRQTTVKTLTQSLTFNGQSNITKNWKVSFNSGYDFITKDFTYTTINIHRNLHCWEMNMRWIPFGTRQSYNFTINVKSSVLQDLKLNRRREWYDN